MDAAVYVSCAGSGEIRVFRLDGASGALAPVQTLAPGGMLMPLATCNDVVYAARRSPPLEVLSFAISRDDGRLTPLGAAPLPHSMASLATDRSGRFLFSASYGGDLVAVSAIDAGGIAREAFQVVPVEPKAHAIRVDVSNRFVFATCLGGGVVRQFRFDDGRLAPNDPPTVVPHAGASPRHLVFSRDGRTAWLLNELDAIVDVLALDATTGVLRTEQSVPSLPPGVTGEAWAADLHATPDGRFLYCSERRASLLAAFRIDPRDGTLAPLGHTPTESQPRGFAISPDGRHLVVAGETSHHVAVHAIDAASGALRRVARQPAGAGPNWIEIVAL